MIHGTYYLSGTSTAKSALRLKKVKSVSSSSAQTLIGSWSTPHPVTLQPALTSPVKRWMSNSPMAVYSHLTTRRFVGNTSSMASRLETSLPFILACLILIPSLFYTIHSIVLPETASYLVHVISDETKHQIGKRSYKSISNLSMSPTGLTSLEEARVRELWEETLQALSLPSEAATRCPECRGPTSPSQTGRSLSRMNWFASMSIQTDSRR